ncbi:hypothetical protein L210DRAFT_3504968 [Boletus edulis BED1]|uniref:Uncharacterized protein n=1 Tax=Boletus edulis BED1 TaxID=1328754 RepID=A0AAD4GDB2_BOLED|nr:hypothetical protein L210DRAFT_3504968 [Boletus edulis BED1]
MDVEEVIVLDREALELHRRTSQPVSVVEQHCVCLSTRYKQLGVMEDLDEAIAHARQSLDLRPKGHPHRFMSLISLAVCIYTRYMRLGKEMPVKVEELEQAIRDAFPVSHLKIEDKSSGCGENYSIFLVSEYGPKPNDELILGYGFSLPDNPDDTMTLQIGGSATSQKWVVGRNSHNVESLWSDIRNMIANGESDYEFEDDLETAAVLTDIVQAKLDGIKTVADVRQNDVIRPTVRAMLGHYIAGQREILESILEFLNEKRGAAIDAAREQGIDLVFDEDDDS